MENLRTQLNRPVVLGAIAFVVGLVIGLVVLGWGIWPVQWSDAAPKHLRVDLQEDYVRMALDSYARTPDEALANRVIEGLGKDNAIKLLAKVSEEYKGKLDPKAVDAYKNLLGVGTAPVPTPTVAPKAGDCGYFTCKVLFAAVARISAP